MPRTAPPLSRSGVLVALFATLSLAAWTSNAGCQGTSSTAAHMVTELGVGDFHTCVRLGDGTVECWGQCGLHCGVRPEGRTERMPVTGLHSAAELAVGDSHACARLEDGHVACWGSNYNSGLGQPTPDASSMPLVVPGLDDVVEIDIGGDLTCARRADATVTCWGRAAGDYENSAEAVPRRMPAPIVGISDALALAVDDTGGCAQVGAPHRWSCWRWILGSVGGAPYVGSATRNSRLDGVGEYGRGTCNCERTSEGAIRCAGTGILSARLPDGSSPPVLLHPCPADGLEGVKQMVDRCALMNDGTVRCWDGLSPPAAARAANGKPTAIEGVSDVVALDVGAAHACALSGGGAVHCWGYNSQGQIDGKPSETFVWPPRRIDMPR